jgi:RNA 2',3'-cyclic 3'-phosphodiesterase
MTELRAMRLFVSVDVSTPVREQLRQAQNELGEAGGDAVRWTLPEQMHLTLRFFGDVASGFVGDIGMALSRACENTPPFELRAAGLGGFPDLRQPRVIWAGLNGEVPTLQALQKEILRETARWGHTDAREFSPHLTIGRVRDGHGIGTLAKKLDAWAAREFGNWRVSEVRLMQSELAPGGARHTELAVIGLK